MAVIWAALLGLLLGRISGVCLLVAGALGAPAAALLMPDGMAWFARLGLAMLAYNLSWLLGALLRPHGGVGARV